MVKVKDLWWVGLKNCIWNATTLFNGSIKFFHQLTSVSRGWMDLKLISPTDWMTVQQDLNESAKASFFMDAGYLRTQKDVGTIKMNDIWTTWVDKKTPVLLFSRTHVIKRTPAYGNQGGLKRLHVWWLTHEWSAPEKAISGKVCVRQQEYYAEEEVRQRDTNVCMLSNQSFQDISLQFHQ